MAFSRSSEAPPILSNAEADSEVARPGPKYRREREGDIKMLAVTSEVGVPDRLGGVGVCCRVRAYMVNNNV